MAQQTHSWHDENAKNIPGSWWYVFDGIPGGAYLTPDRHEGYRVLEKAYRALGDKFREQEKEFIRAAAIGDLNKMEILLATGIHINAIDSDSMTALMRAAESGNVAVCRFLVDAGASITYLPCRNKEAALSRAAWKGHEDVCRLLLDAEKRSDKINRELHAEALSRAVFMGHFGICEMLLAAGANPYRKDDHGNSILFKAYLHAGIEANRIPMCEMLIEHMLSSPSKEQSQRAVTFLCCMRVNNCQGEYSNLRNIFKGVLIGMFFEENKNRGHRAYAEVKNLPWDTLVKKHLMNKYFPNCVGMQNEQN